MAQAKQVKRKKVKIYVGRCPNCGKFTKRK